VGLDGVTAGESEPVLGESSEAKLGEALVARINRAGGSGRGGLARSL
jgi:hypothetical protein